MLLFRKKAQFGSTAHIQQTAANGTRRRRAHFRDVPLNPPWVALMLRLLMLRVRFHTCGPPCRRLLAIYVDFAFTDATVVSLDGRCAYDPSHVQHSGANCVRSPRPVPFVRLWYGQESTSNASWDATSARRSIHHGEGCEQGDALAPALYALGCGRVNAWSLSWTMSTL